MVTMTEAQGRSIKPRSRAPAGLWNALTLKSILPEIQMLISCWQGRLQSIFTCTLRWMPCSCHHRWRENTAVSLAVRSRAALGGRGMPVGFTEPGTDIPPHVCQDWEPLEGVLLVVGKEDGVCTLMSAWEMSEGKWGTPRSEQSLCNAAVPLKTSTKGRCPVCSACQESQAQDLNPTDEHLHPGSI